MYFLFGSLNLMPCHDACGSGALILTLEDSQRNLVSRDWENQLSLMVMNFFCHSKTFWILYQAFAYMWCAIATQLVIRTGVSACCLFVLTLCVAIHNGGWCEHQQKFKIQSIEIPFLTELYLLCNIEIKHKPRS